MKSFKSHINEKLQQLQDFDLMSEVRRPRTYNKLIQVLRGMGAKQLGSGNFSAAYVSYESYVFEFKGKTYVVKTNTPGDGLSGKDAWVDWGMYCKNNFHINPFLPAIHAIYPFRENDTDFVLGDNVNDNDLKTFKFGFYAVMEYLEIGEKSSRDIPDMLKWTVALQNTFKKFDESDHSDMLQLIKYRNPNFHKTKAEFEDFERYYGFESPFSYYGPHQDGLREYFGIDNEDTFYYPFSNKKYFANVLDLNGGVNGNYYKTCEAISKFVLDGKTSTDMHGLNFGIRNGRQVVFTDPFSWKK